MLNCVFWRHIPLEIEFKSRVDMGSDSNRYIAQRYDDDDDDDDRLYLNTLILFSKS